MTACLTHCTASGTSSSSVPFIKPPRISNTSSLRSTSLFLLPPPILSHASPSGQSMALPLVSSQPVFGSLLMNVATKHSQSPNSSITSWAGSSTLGGCYFFFVVDLLRVRRGAKETFLPVSLGVPYHSWRITHAKHHASTAHMTQDQVFVPRTRSQRGLPPLNPDGESLLGASISNEIMKELHEAIGDSPIGAVFGSGSYLVRRCELR